MPSPFDNPLTRNRAFPTIHFAQSDEERKNLHTPAPVYSYEDAVNAYNDLHVPQKEPEIDALAGFNLEEDKTLGPDEWSKTRWRNYSNSTHGDWGDPMQSIRDELNPKPKEELDLASQKYAEVSKVENAKLSAELEADEARKKMLKDLETGRIFALTRLQDDNPS